MTVVDIRSFFTLRNVELIEVNEDFIYYAEEKNEEGHNNLFLLEYNRATRRERVITHYSLEDPTFVQHIYSFANSIVLLLENGGNRVWAFRVDKETGQETVRTQLHCIGGFAGSKALDERHILIYTQSDGECADLFKEYQKVTGCNRVAYLYDIEKEEKFFIKNLRLCRRQEEDFLLFSTQEGGQVLLLEPYGDEELKQRCYRNARWIHADIRDSLWILPVEELIEGIQRGEEDFRRRPIMTADVNGMVRFTGMDSRSIYFKAKHFPTGGERICSYDKEDGTIEVLTDLEQPGEENWRYYFEKNGAKVYRLEEKEDDTVVVTGIVNSNIQTKYEKKLGELVSCVEDRFLITKKTVTDDKEHDDFEYYTIYDTVKNTEDSFECKGSVWGDTLVLY